MIVRVLLYWLKIICSSAAANSLAQVYLYLQNGWRKALQRGC